MAASLKSLLALARNSTNHQILQLNTRNTATRIVPKRTITCTETGALLPKPEQTKFGVAKVLLVVIPFLYMGGSFASNCAALLEDYELFVPLDDDDD